MTPYFQDKGVTLYQADCLEAMRFIPDASIDACITDPPYGTTACSWDAVIPFLPMWAELKRIVKKNGAIVLFGSQPFTSALVMSNPQMFKYEWIWNKNGATCFVHAKHRPLGTHEDIVVFGEGTIIYNPQFTKGDPYYRGFVNTSRNRTCPTSDKPFLNQNQTGLRYPKTILLFDNNDRVMPLHPTQKPVELLRYLVRTYTNEGDTVLDFTCGSGTTGVACAIERREFIGIEQDAHYCGVSEARIKRAQGIACDIPKRVKQYAPTPLFEAVA